MAIQMRKNLFYPMLLGTWFVPLCNRTFEGILFQTFQKFEYIRAYLSRQVGSVVLPVKLVDT